MNASRANDVIAVLPHDPSPACWSRSHRSARPTASLVLSSILTLSFSGVVGIGFMGRIHYLASQRLAGAKVAAVCTRDPAKRAGDWRNTRGNFGPEPGRVDLSGVKAYAALDQLLADPDIDMVDVCAVTD